MPKFTNNSAGLRGVNLKDGSTVWVEPGQTVEVDGVGHPDLEGGKEIKPSKESEASEPNSQDAFDGMSDEALRDHIEETTGEKPDGRMGRAKLLKAARGE